MKKFILLILASTIFASCMNSGKTDQNTVMAKVNGSKITYGDLVKKYPELQKQLLKMEEQMYRYKKAYVEKMADDKILELEAKKQNISVNELVAKNIASKVGGVTDADVTKFGKERNLKPEQVSKLKDRIKMFLQRQKEENAKNAFIGSLKANYEVKILVEKPNRPTIKVTVDSADPQIGPKSSKVTVVEFSDFQCPFCKRASLGFRKIVAEYKDRVHFVWKNFPLSFHKRARPAALAAMCANEQGKFWEYHDKAFDNNTAFSDADLVKYAKEVGVSDMKKFEDCYNSKKYDNKINATVAEGTKYGISGTPSAFINGVLHVGALDYNSFKKIIDDALNN